MRSNWHGKIASICKCFLFPIKIWWIIGRNIKGQNNRFGKYFYGIFLRIVFIGINNKLGVLLQVSESVTVKNIALFQHFIICLIGLNEQLGRDFVSFNLYLNCKIILLNSLQTLVQNNNWKGCRPLKNLVMVNNTFWRRNNKRRRN